MASPFVGEVRMFAGLGAPAGWLLCDGSILPINVYTTLFSLIGTSYGGNGTATFGIPDLRGRVPIHLSGAYPLATQAGAETVTLAQPNLPAHGHSVQCNGAAGTLGGPKGNFLAGCTINPQKNLPVDNLYFTGSPAGQMASGVIVPNAGGTPHDNIQPFVVINFIIAYEGLYPGGG